MRAVGYFRVSDEEQMEGWSPDAQKRGFEEFCAGRNWPVVDYYDEEWRSAWGESIEKRPKFKKLLEDAQKGLFDVVVVHTLDRFARNLRVLLEAFAILSKHNVSFVCIQQQIDYSTPEGKLFMMMLGAFSQYFSDAISMHTRKGMKERAQQGLFNGEPPFGYERCDADCFGLDGHPGCHIDLEKASLVKEMFVRYAAGNTSLSLLASWMNDQGMTTKSRRGVKLYDGTVINKERQFTQFSVKHILHNRFYLGKVRYKEQEFQGLHSPLVDEEAFDEVQRRLRAAHHGGSSGVHSRSTHMLKGLVRCAHCGHSLWAEIKGRQQARYYREPLIRSADACDYSGRSLRSDAIDMQMDMVFDGLQLRPDWKDWLAERLGKGNEKGDIEAQRVKLSGRLARLRDLYLEGDITKETYEKQKWEVQQVLDSLIVPGMSASVRAGELIKNLPELWGRAGVAQRNRLLTSILSAVFLDYDRCAVVGLLPRPSFRELLLCLEERESVTIYENEGRPHPHLQKESFVSVGGDGGGSKPAHTYIYDVPPYSEKLVLGVQVFANGNIPFLDVAQYLRAKRRDAGLTQKAVADALGIHPVSYKTWEQGKKLPRKDNWQKLVGVLDIAPDEVSRILSLTESPSGHGRFVGRID